MTRIESGHSLLCRVAARYCALPLEGVVETTRPLPIESVTGTPDFVLGLTVLRGAAIPVVDAGRLLGGRASVAARFVILKVGERRIALAVEGVLGVRATATLGAGDLPPLIRVAEAEAVSAIGALDYELLLVLRSARIVPDELFETIEERALAS